MGAARGAGFVALLIAAASLLHWATPSPGSMLGDLANLLEGLGPGRRATIPSVESGVVAVAALVAWALLTLISALTVLTLLASLPGRVGRLASLLRELLGPPTLTRLVVAALGVTVGAGVPAAAGAATSAEATSTVWATGATGPVADPGVDWPGLSPAQPRESSVPYTVRRGDSLWAIAESELGSDAHPAATDRRWRLWYEENRAVIGADPNLILPGQVLGSPGANYPSSASERSVR